VGIGGSTYFTTALSFGSLYGGGGRSPECSASFAVTGGFFSKSAAELSGRAEEVAIRKKDVASRKKSAAAGISRKR